MLDYMITLNVQKSTPCDVIKVFHLDKPMGIRHDVFITSCVFLENAISEKRLIKRLQVSMT